MQRETSRIVSEPRGETFCMMPWVHLHVTQLGTVTPCCQAPWGAERAFGDVNTQSLEEIWNDEPIRRFRTAMLEGQRDPRCSRCYDKERSGLTSLRQITNDDYTHRLDWVDQTEADGSCPPSRPVYLDIRFSNVCNFRCRICSPASSSRWYEDAKTLGLLGQDAAAVTRAAKDPARLMREIEGLVDGLDEIYFAGGEPLVMDEHYALLDLLIARGRTGVRLKYNTNFSHLTFKGKDILQYWSRFPNVIVSASLDGSYARGELQRKEQVWAETVGHARRLREQCPHVQFQVTPTVSVFYLLHLPDFHREWTELGLFDVAHFWPSVLTQPAAYNIRVLPAAMKQRARDLYKAHIGWVAERNTAFPRHRERSVDFWGAVLRHLDSADHSHLVGEFVERTSALDRVRGEMTATVFPELGSLLDAGPREDTVSPSSERRDCPGSSS